MRERFDARLRSIPAGALHGLLRVLSEIEAFRGWWDGARKPARPALLRIRESVISRSAAHSTRGTRAVPPPDSRGYAGALRAVFDGYAEMPPVEDRILALHAEVFRHLPGERILAGRYKSATPRLGSDRRFLSEPVALRSPGPLLIPAQMETLTGWLRSGLDGGEFHPLLVVAAYLLEFLAIRPFPDGNGRMSRLLTNLLLMRCGHAYLPYGSLDAAIAVRREEYYIALRRSQASRNLPRPDISPWLFSFLGALAIQQREAREAIARLPDEGALSANQSAVMALAARREEVTNREVAATLGLSRETAKQTLNRLVSLGALRRLGAGRATRYRLRDGA